MRKAFAYGADRKSAVEAGFHGVIPYEGNPSVSQATPGYNAETAKAYAFDQAKANELLDRAGWTERNADKIRVKDGKPECLRGTFFGDSPMKDGAQDETWWLELMQYIDQNYRTMGETEVDWTE